MPTPARSLYLKLAFFISLLGLIQPQYARNRLDLVLPLLTVLRANASIMLPPKTAIPTPGNSATVR